MSDLHLKGATPYVDLKPHPWRSLKTADSTRKVPLVGAGLWVAKGLSDLDGHLFPQYNKAEETNSNSVSAALNKWMKLIA